MGCSRSPHVQDAVRAALLGSPLDGDFRIAFKLKPRFQVEDLVLLASREFPCSLEPPGVDCNVVRCARRNVLGTAAKHYLACTARGNKWKCVWVVATFRPSQAFWFMMAAPTGISTNLLQLWQVLGARMRCNALWTMPWFAHRTLLPSVGRFWGQRVE
ncbi:unnamed protein product [Symbiodinium natans]|uniref:Uncharacterized protein n=1 Tax=Symbiodinium natans TaxID=878477 RepID=A0A812KYW4_9DINO|nr:unnamed protein product [Symbiodinium natans]